MSIGARLASLVASAAYHLTCPLGPLLEQLLHLAIVKLAKKTQNC